MGEGPDAALWGSGARRSVEVQQLAARLLACEARADEVLAGFWAIQMSQWQSPAGQAYRNRVGLEAVALRRTVEALREAAASVSGHARAVLTSDCTYGGSS